MPAAPVADPALRDILRDCAHALQKVADYEMEPELEQRMQSLGERKEFLDGGQHDELMGLVAFANRRTRESLEARLALRRLREAAPDLADRP